MIRRTGLIAIAGLVLCAGPPHAIGAQEPSAPSTSAHIDAVGGLGLDEAIARARGAEPGLQAARSDVAVAQGLRQQSGLRRNPTTTLEGRSEPGGTDSLLSIGLEWPLELFRRRARINTADRQVAVAQLSANEKERLLVGDVVLQYGRAAAAIREAQVASDVATAAERQLDVVRARANEGAAPRLEGDLLEVELRRVQAERDLALGRAERAVLVLKPLLGMEPGDRLVLRESIEVLVSARAGRPASVPRTVDAAGRADVQVAAEQVAVAEARVQEAQREGRFDLSLFGTYMRMDSGFPQLGLSAAGTPERVRAQFHYVSGGVMLMLPLLDRNQGKVAAARAERTAAEARRRAVELAAAADVAAARVRVERALQALTVYRDSTRELARRNLDVVRQTFELGRATTFDVLAEQRRYLEFEREYTTTLLEAWEAHSDLRRALGELK